MTLTQQWKAPVDANPARLNTASIPVVTNPFTDISDGIGPFRGQVVFCTTDSMLHRYDGCNHIFPDHPGWSAFAAAGGNTADTMHEARYEQKALQTIPNAIDTALGFPTAAYSCSDVTDAGGIVPHSEFILERPGLWLVTASMRWVANAGGGERHLFLMNGLSLPTLANRFVGSTSGNVGNTPVSLSIASTIRVTEGSLAGAGAFIKVGCWQNCGGNLNTDVGFGGSNHISLTWLRPL